MVRLPWSISCHGQYPDADILAHRGGGFQRHVSRMTDSRCAGTGHRHRPGTAGTGCVVPPRFPARQTRPASGRRRPHPKHPPNPGHDRARSGDCTIPARATASSTAIGDAAPCPPRSGRRAAGSPLQGSTTPVPHVPRRQAPLVVTRSTADRRPGPGSDRRLAGSLAGSWPGGSPPRPACRAQADSPDRALPPRATRTGGRTRRRLAASRRSGSSRLRRRAAPVPGN